MTSSRYIRLALLLFASLSLTALYSAPALSTPPARILVYGDSNTWGWEATASGFPVRRHDPADRWPEVVRQRLDTRIDLAVDALSGRTVDADHVSAIGPLTPEDFNGKRGIAAAVARELPLDLVVVMLGTNDVANDQGRSPEQIAAGMAAMARTIRNIDGGVLTVYPAPRVLVIVPPPIGDTSRTPIGTRFDAESQRKSRALAAACQEALAGIEGVSIFDAVHAVGTLDGMDGIHLTGEQQRRLGAALGTEVLTLLAPSP